MKVERSPRPFSSLLLLVGLAALGSGGLTACGPKGPEPVEIPADLSTDPKVNQLLEKLRAKAVSNPEDPRTHRRLGLALAVNGFWTPAEVSFANALELDAEDMESRYQLARAKGELGHWEERLAILQKLVDEHPDFSPARYLLACDLADQSRLDESQVEFQKLKDIHPNFPHGPLGLGAVAMARDDAVKARGYFQLARELAPEDNYSRFQLGQALLALGETKYAMQLLEGLESTSRPTLRSPGTIASLDYAVAWSSRLNTAIGWLNENNVAQAVAMLEILHREKPDEPICSNNLATGYQRSGRIEEALAIFDKAIEQHPEQYVSRVNQAFCLLQLAAKDREAGRGDNAEAKLEKGMQALDSALQTSPRYAKAHEMRGRLLSFAGKGSEAINAWRKTVALGGIEEDTFLFASSAESVGLRRLGKLAHCVVEGRFSRIECPEAV